jgi:hypothetical protein
VTGEDGLIPAQAGIQTRPSYSKDWIPVFTGTTEKSIFRPINLSIAENPPFEKGGSGGISAAGLYRIPPLERGAKTTQVHSICILRIVSGNNNNKGANRECLFFFGRSRNYGYP